MMNEKEIKAKLILKGIKQVDIARDLGLDKTTVNKIIHRRGRSKRIEEYIANLLGLSYEKVWDE